MFSAASLGEKGAERFVKVGGHAIHSQASIGLDAMLKAVQLPAGVTYLHASLTHMDWDALTLQEEENICFYYILLLLLYYTITTTTITSFKHTYNRNESQKGALSELII